MNALTPKIEFSHVLGELSVNRNDPCELLRELISNSYDAAAKDIIYSPLDDNNGLIFFDNGTGLPIDVVRNGVTPWEAFFSIGKSTKQKGEGIGYKCQGSKLCFASSRVLVATKHPKKVGSWYVKSIDNPRNNLNITTDITPQLFDNLDVALNSFFPSPSAKMSSVLDGIKSFIASSSTKTGTLIVIDELDTEGFTKYFSFSKLEQSYVYNYVRFSSSHGDVRRLSKDEGFSPNHIQQVSSKLKPVNLYFLVDGKPILIPFGFPYLKVDSSDTAIKSPSQVSRLRDGRFFSRSAKAFNIGSSRFSVILAIDGNRKAHEEYKNLDRKGAAKSGIRLSDQRGLFISVKGIKICKYFEIIAKMPKYQVLSEGDSPGHYTMIIDGDFDLVTNRNALSKKAFDTLCEDGFVEEIQKFLDAQAKSDKIFAELLLRLRKESAETLLNEQISILDASKNRLKERERFRIESPKGNKLLFVSPLPGEEYSVGVLYAVLGGLAPAASPTKAFWHRIITFSTQGIDSLALLDPASSQPLAVENIGAVEYKYEFSNNGPFNHALAVVDYLIAWSVDVDVAKRIDDSFTCFGSIRKMDGNDFAWEIYDIENIDGGTYDHSVKVINLKKLISSTFLDVKFVNS